MRVGPAHGELQQVVQFGQCDIRGYQQAPPDGRLGPQQRNFELIDFVARAFSLRLAWSAFLCLERRCPCHTARASRRTYWVPVHLIED